MIQGSANWPSPYSTQQAAPVEAPSIIYEVSACLDGPSERSAPRGGIASKYGRQSVAVLINPCAPRAILAATAQRVLRLRSGFYGSLLIYRAYFSETYSPASVPRPGPPSRRHRAAAQYRASRADWSRRNCPDCCVLRSYPQNFRNWRWWAKRRRSRRLQPKS